MLELPSAGGWTEGRGFRVKRVWWHARAKQEGSCCQHTAGVEDGKVAMGRGHYTEGDQMRRGGR